MIRDPHTRITIMQHYSTVPYCLNTTRTPKESDILLPVILPLTFFATFGFPPFLQYSSIPNDHNQTRQTFSSPSIADMGLSHAQEVALAIAPKVGGGISILGSLWIFWDILTSREKRQQVYHRIMFMISSFDIIVSSGAFSSTWPMTEDTDPWKGRGSDTTCKIQGFAMQLGGTLFTYNAALSVFYVLMIVFHLKEELLKKYEWTLHIVPLTFGISTATIAMGMDWYHNANLWCWIAVDPACSDELYASLNVEYCSRYNNIWIFRWAFFFAPLWACFAVQIASMMVVLRTVHHQEARTKENTQKISHHQEPDIMSESDNSEEAEIQSVSPPGDREEAHPDCVEQSDKPLEKQEFRRTRQVATQAVLYICAFYMTYFFATLNRILQQVRGSSPYIVLLMHTLSLPQQGQVYIFLALVRVYRLFF